MWQADGEFVACDASSVSLSFKGHFPFFVLYHSRFAADGLPYFG